jgi:hypothetical protein
MPARAMLKRDVNVRSTRDFLGAPLTYLNCVARLARLRVGPFYLGFESRHKNALMRAMPSPVVILSRVGTMRPEIVADIG